MSRAAGVQVRSYGMLPDGRPVNLFELVNEGGLRARILDYGAILVGLDVPDRLGCLADVTLGYDALGDWLANPCYFGATVGRFANRIAGGRFMIDGREVQLARNEGGFCHLHGGVAGFNRKLWTGCVVDERTVEFTLHSPNGDEGYPGNLDVVLTYALTDDNELVWSARATTDADTLVNLAHHSYWNLSGRPDVPILDHELRLDAPRYLPTRDGIPTGEVAPVLGTPMDFLTARRIGGRIDEEFEPVRARRGYDHCWVFSEADGVRTVGALEDPGSGRRMEIRTDQPGVQVYTGNFLDDSLVGKGGIRYGRHSGVCLETQGFPDSPNHPAFPSCILRPGDVYRHTLVHRFSVS